MLRFFFLPIFFVLLLQSLGFNPKLSRVIFSQQTHQRVWRRISVLLGAHYSMGKLLLIVWVLHLVSFCGWCVSVKHGNWSSVSSVTHSSIQWETAQSLKRDWKMRLSAEITVHYAAVYFTSCNVLAGEQTSSAACTTGPIPPTPSVMYTEWCMRVLHKFMRLFGPN